MIWSPNWGEPAFSERITFENAFWDNAVRTSFVFVSDARSTLSHLVAEKSHAQGNHVTIFIKIYITNIFADMKNDSKEILQ